MAKKQFKAESKRLLDLMIHSIYTNKEIFLRELISNASDAVDKLCYVSLTDSSVGLNREDFFIELRADKEKRTLTIVDNGIGMTKDELEQNLGTIAQSGSLHFKNDLKEKQGDSEQDIDIIGQFGVGFYSAFMVGDEVTVISRAHGEDTAYCWKSTGSDGYTITECEREEVGTTVIIHLKEDTENENYSRFLEEHTLTSLVKKYSDYIRYPIRMEVEQRKLREGTEDEYDTVKEMQTLNSMVPIWQRNKAELKEEDYHTFYTEKFYDFEKPLRSIHMDAEGLVSFKALLFIPAKASYDYYTREYQKGLQLYSSGVLIMDKCADLLPEHFRFVRGVVDSPDLSLNISREMLQQTHQLKVIATNIEKKIKNELSKMLINEREEYEKFFNAFGLQLKYGITADFGAHKEMLQDLLLFRSSDSDKNTTLAEYVTRMKPDQKHIYYATGDTVQKIACLPQTELIREKGYEILYFTDEVDEFIAQTLRTYKEKTFLSVNADDPDLQTDEEKKEAEKQVEENKDLLTFIKDALGEKVKEVKLSNKLKTHPVCLTPGDGMSFEMEKYLQNMKTDLPMKADRILELNPNHKMFETLQSLSKEEPDRAKQYIDILYHQALLMAGLPIEDPVAYSNLVFSVL